MSMMKRRALTLVAGLGSLLLAACSGVGEGNALKSLVIASSSDTTLTYDDLKAGTVDDAVAYQCISSGLTLYGLFTKENSVGSFTDRATWTSADESIVKVSNGDIAVPGQEDSFYIHGTLIPVGVGSTTVTARYLDLTASIPVHVAAPSEITMEPSDPRIAINTVQGFSIRAKLDGVPEDITVRTVPTVAFSPVNDTVATAGLSSGVPFVTGLAQGGPLTLNVTLPICGQVLSTTVRVAPIVTLDLQHEPGFSGELIVPTNEALKTMADFGEGPEQDVTTQSTYAVDVSSDATATSRIASSSNFVTATTAGALASVSAQCCARDRNADGDILDEGEAAVYTSNLLPITPVAGTLTAFSISPTDGSGEQYTNQQFSVTGTFDSGAPTQPITRFVTWKVTDPATATSTTEATVSPLFAIGSGTFISTAGLGVSQLPPTAAKITVATPLTVTATLVSSLQPDTELPAISTTFTLTPLTEPAP